MAQVCRPGVATMEGVWHHGEPLPGLWQVAGTTRDFHVEPFQTASPLVEYLQLSPCCRS